MRRYIFLLFFIHCSILLSGQGKVKPLYTPKDYKEPRFESKSDFDAAYVKLDKDFKDKNNFWRVFSDRANNPTRTEPKNYSKEFKMLGFRDGPFYVVDETDDGWIKIVKSDLMPSDISDKKELKDYEDFGWIEKGKMLLWTNGLLTRNEAINMKGYVFNKAGNLDINNLEKAYLYDSPVGGNVLSTIPLDIHTFIYKIHFGGANGDKEERYLVCRESTLGAKVKNLMGWVDEKKIQRWDTRLALEPNFTYSGFEERKSNEKFRIKGYNKPPDISGAVVVWNSDPVLSPSANLHERRWKGNEFRFPILEAISEKTFKAGALCEIGDGKGSKLVENISKLTENTISKSNRVNVFFLLEGSTVEMKNYVEPLVQYIQQLDIGDKKLKLGVGIYKDVNETDREEVFKYIALTENKAKVIQMLRDNYWGKTGDNDEHTIMKSALRQTLLKAGFETNSTNVIIQVGNSADVFANKARRREPKTIDHIISDDEENKLADKFNEFEIHWFNFKISENSKINASKDYNYQIRDFMNKCVKEQYDVMQKDGRNPPDPFIPELESTNKIEVTGFKQFFSFIRPQEGGIISTEFLVKNITREMDKLAGDLDKRAEYAISKEESVKSGNIEEFRSVSVWDPAALAYWYQLNKGIDKKMTQEEFIKQLTEKAKNVKFFSNVIFPKKISGAKEDPFKYVLLFPEDDLKSYHSRVTRVLDAGQAGSEADIRDALFEQFIAMAEEITSQKSVGQNMELKINEVNLLMQGIKNQTDFDISSRFNFAIKDIKNKKVVTKEKLNELIKSYSTIEENIDKIRIEGKKYPYAFEITGATTYYWIDLELVIP